MTRPSGSRASHFVRAVSLAEIPAEGCLPLTVEGQTITLFRTNGQIYAVDNRCPHMGFPLHRGSVRDGILTCQWHYARFDLATGGTFDSWADELRVFPVELRDGEIWIDVGPRGDRRAHLEQRLRDGLERSILLVLGKAVVGLLEAGTDPVEPFRIGLEFGVHNRAAGWSSGLTILTCLMHLLPDLAIDDRPRALFHGLAAVARDCAGSAPRRLLRPLPGQPPDLPTLGRWFRQFVEVRDAEGAERCLVSAVAAGANDRELAGMLFAAATDHRYLDGGHTLDFTNKALEALDVAGWTLAAPVLASLVPSYVEAERLEEASSWRHPEDLVALLDGAYAVLPAALEAGASRRGPWPDRAALAEVVLSNSATAIVDGLLDALRAGCPPVELAGTVAYAAALRVARFHTSNEFGDWDTAHHAFTYANAVHQGLRRVPSIELLRGVFDAAIAIYLNRFLNIPPARLPALEPVEADPNALLRELPALLDRRQQVNEAATIVARYLGTGGEPERLLATLGGLLLREDRDFHTIQEIEAAFRQFRLLQGTPEAAPVLIAATRYLAAHAPTTRSQGQTYQIAYRLSRGDQLYEEE